MRRGKRVLDGDKLSMAEFNVEWNNLKWGLLRIRIACRAGYARRPKGMKTLLEVR